MNVGLIWWQNVVSPEPTPSSRLCASCMVMGTLPKRCCSSLFALNLDGLAPRLLRACVLFLQSLLSPLSRSYSLLFCLIPLISSAFLLLLLLSLLPFVFLPPSVALFYFSSMYAFIADSSLSLLPLSFTAPNLFYASSSRALSPISPRPPASWILFLPL